MTARKRAPSRRRRTPRNPKKPPRLTEARLAEIRAWIEAGPDEGPLDRIPNARCPDCGKRALERREDLELDWVRDGERIVLANLSGHRCTACGKPWLDRRSERIVSRHIDATRPRGGYSATVSALGGGKLGIYLPKDVLRNVDLARNDALLITPVNRRKMVVEKVESDG